MTDLGLFDRDRIRALLGEVAGELAGTSSRHTIVIVGGSLLAWHGLREATADVDTVRPITGELRDAVALVAARNHLAVGWLNEPCRRMGTGDIQRRRVGSWSPNSPRADSSCHRPDPRPC